MVINDYNRFTLTGTVDTAPYPWYLKIYIIQIFRFPVDETISPPAIAPLRALSKDSLRVIRIAREDPVA